MKKFKIALIGSHCSSKTTLACYLTQKLKSNGYPDTMLREEIARRCPFPINEQGGFQANLWITLQTILDEAELKDKCTILVCDRSVFDQIVYSADAWTYGRMRQNEFVFIRRTVEEWVTIDPYDLVFLLQPQGLIADSVRPDNKEWQEKIWNGFLFWCNKMLQDKYVLVGGNLRTRKDIIFHKTMEMISHAGN